MIVIIVCMTFDFSYFCQLSAESNLTWSLIGRRVDTQTLLKDSTPFLNLARTEWNESDLVILEALHPHPVMVGVCVISVI